MSVTTRPSPQSVLSLTGERWTRHNLGLIAALTLLVGVVLFYNLGGCRTLGSHEIYAVVPAHEMMTGGDWILPRFGGLPRLEKPPLDYWVIAAFSRCAGCLTATTARLPAALSALLLAMIAGLWAGKWYGRNAGLAAAVVQSTSFYVIVFGRKAEVDMLLCLLTTAALFLVAHQNPRESSRRSFLRWIGVYALLSLAWLAKFHYGVVMVLGPTVVYYLLQRRTRMLRHLVCPLGLGLLAASVFVWPRLVLNRFPQAATIWRQETVGRVVGVQGTEPIWFYLPHLIELTLPWTLFAMAAVPASWRRAWAGTRALWRQSESRREFFKRFAAAGDERERFLWVWFLTDVAILTVSASKHKHYLLAALPMMSLLAGQTLARWAAMFHRGKPMFGRYRAAGLALGFLAAALTGFVLVTSRWPSLTNAAATAAGLVAIGGCLAVWLLSTGRSLAAVYLVIAVFIGCDIVVMGWILPGRDRGRSIVQFAGTVRREVPSNHDVCVYRMGKNPIVYYLDGPVRRLEAEAALDRRLRQCRCLYVITATDRVAELSKFGRVRTLQFVKPVDGQGLPKHFRMVLTELTASRPLKKDRKDGWGRPKEAPNPRSLGGRSTPLFRRPARPRHAARRVGTVAVERSSKREKIRAAF